MPIPPVDPITILTVGLNIGIRVFEITYQLKSVGPQTADLLKTIDHVNRNIKEAQRLRQQKDALLSIEEAEWMDGIIQDTLDARLALARLIEPVRVEQQTKKSISLTNRALWILRDNPNVANTHRKLTEIHQSLTSLIACLYSKDAIVITPADISMTQHLTPPPYDPDMAQLFERRTLRRRRRSMSNFPDGRRESLNSSGSMSLEADPSVPTPSCFPPPLPAIHNSAQGLCIDETVARTTQMNSFGLSEAALWASSDDMICVTTPNASPTSPGYVDESAALHALQHLNLANADLEISARPPRPPKIPLSGAIESQSNDIVGRATATNPAKRDALEKNIHTTSPTRKTKTSWLAYHATRSDAGHYQPFP